MKTEKRSQHISVLLFVFLLLSFYVFGQNSITYQGTVVKSGGSVPPNGNYGMRFGLWNRDIDGDPALYRLWQESHINADAVAVTNGAFSVELGSITVFPADFFTDNFFLWLEVEINLSGVDDSALEVYTPRVRFSKTPYSFYSDNSSLLGKISPSSFLRSDVNDTCSGNILFKGVPTGKYISDAVIWICPSSSNLNDAVFSMSTSGLDMIVMSNPGNLTASGVIQAGTTTYPVAYNRIGDGTATNANIDNNNDLLINGSLEVKNGIYWPPKNNYIGYIPADFVPFESGYTYIGGSTFLYKKSGDITNQIWYAPVHLPEGAVVTELRVWFTDFSVEDLDVSLRRKAYGSLSYTVMASIITSGTPGLSDLIDNTIDYDTIDNMNYVYCIYIIFPAADTYSYLAFQHAKITYMTSGM